MVYLLNMVIFYSYVENYQRVCQSHMQPMVLVYKNLHGWLFFWANVDIPVDCPDRRQPHVNRTSTARQPHVNRRYRSPKY